MTDPTPVPTTDITPPVSPRAPRTRKPRPEPDRELAVMTAMVAALDSLPDDAARRRVLHYLTSRTSTALSEATLEPAPLPRRPVPIPLATPPLTAEAREFLASMPGAPVFGDDNNTSVSGECVEMLTPDEWLKRDYPDVKILDCDGWKPEEWDTPCTEAEFSRRLARCTTQANVRPPAVNPFATFPRTNPPAERKS